jgi:hypothetical protein
VLRIDDDGFLELRQRLIGVSMILVEQAQVVVNLGARIVLFKQYSILGQSALELTDALVASPK